jgi:hypothetical protein
MQTYADLVELAKTCSQQARFTRDREVARELWRMALEYRYKAGALDSGKAAGYSPVAISVGTRAIDAILSLRSSRPLN